MQIAGLFFAMFPHDFNPDVPYACHRANLFWKIAISRCASVDACKCCIHRAPENQVLYQDCTAEDGVRKYAWGSALVAGMGDPIGGADARAERCCCDGQCGRGGRRWFLGPRDKTLDGCFLEGETDERRKAHSFSAAIKQVLSDVDEVVRAIWTSFCKLLESLPSIFPLHGRCLQLVRRMLEEAVARFSSKGPCFSYFI